ncbi:MAG: rod shape-determining protein MreD [Gammaproteobacteria bacterium]|nr:rod shape-determining protein MreD [Gammaproteobacteria bacterium]
MLPLPDWARPFRPDWVTLVAIYWAMATPRLFGMAFAWIVGLILDVSQGTLLGQHALGLVLITYIITLQYQRIRIAPLGQQALIVTALLILKQTIVLWANGLVNRLPEHPLIFYAPCLFGLFLWPWIFIILRDIRRRFSIT